MKQSAHWINSDERPIPEALFFRRLSFVRFLLRYPIFILAFGPPLLRSEAIDATKGKIDIWSFLQVGLLSAIATRAIWRLVAAKSISLPKQIRSVLRLAFFLGFLYLASIEYSPGRFVSAAYSIINLLTLICVAEFVVDVYRNPPDWIQCLFHLRLIALLLLALALVALLIDPKLVMVILEGAGIRFLGGTVAPVILICSMIAIISAFNFLYSLERRGKSALLFLVGLAGVLSTRTRGGEIALLLCLLILIIGWAKSSRRIMTLFIPGFIAFTLLSGALVGVVGGGRIWSTFNRGQSAEGIASASGRTEIWKFVIDYSIKHPQGMGYVAGFRILFRNYWTLGSQIETSRIGGAHNNYLQVLADAGWLALAVYLIMLIKIVRLALRFTKQQPLSRYAPDRESRDALRCWLLLLIYCFVDGMDSSDMMIPMWPSYYWQYIIIAIILGISARMIAASRARHLIMAK